MTRRCWLASDSLHVCMAAHVLLPLHPAAVLPLLPLLLLVRVHRRIVLLLLLQLLLLLHGRDSGTPWYAA
jgi:hypothetical protein